MSEEIIVKPIGVIETSFKSRDDLKGPPNRADSAYNNPNITGVIHIFDEYKDGIRDIEPGSSIMLVFHFNQSEGYRLITNSPNFDSPVGVFSTRSPNRPNGIGVTIVNVLDVSESKIVFQGVDMLDGTPLLDIKPQGKKVEQKEVQ